MLVVITNTGDSSVTISSMAMNNIKFSFTKWKLPRVLEPGKSAELGVSFEPTAAGWQRGELSIYSNASNVTFNLPMSGGGVTSQIVTARPASLYFGKVAVGQSSSVPIELTNRGDRNVVIQRVTRAGAAFSFSGVQFPLTLQVGQTVNLTATFTPAAKGQIGGSIFVDGPALNIPLVGTGTDTGPIQGELSITPATLNFGNVAVGGTATLKANLSATKGSVTVSSVSSSSSLFAVTNATFPLTIPEGSTVSLDVEFTPQHSAQRSGSLSFASNATDSPTSEALTGTGTPPYVSLSWSASESPDVVGYNIYRSTSGTKGTYARLNPKLDADTYFTDSTVAGDTTYYYATTAVNSSGKESGFSNKAEVVVP